MTKKEEEVREEAPTVPIVKRNWSVSHFEYTEGANPERSELRIDGDSEDPEQVRVVINYDNPDEDEIYLTLHIADLEALVAAARKEAADLMSRVVSKKDND